MTRLAYFEWSTDLDPDCPDPARDPDGWREWAGDRQRWADANPALGIRITEDAIETELGALDPADFARERLGLFSDELGAAEPMISDELWSACEQKGSQLVGAPVFAFEVSPDRRWSHVAVAGPSTLGGLHVEIVESRRYTGWVAARLVELVAKHGAGPVRANWSGPAGALKADCENVGLEVEPVTGGELPAACAAAFDDIVEGRWCHIGQPVLNLAVAEAAQRSVGDAWVVDRRGAADVSALMAVVLAAFGARAPAGESVYEERGLLIL